MSLTADEAQRFARQILLAPVGGAGQLRWRQSRILLHGEAPLCRTYLERAGVGAVTEDGAADLVLDLGDGSAYRSAARPRLWGGVVAGRVRLGGELPKSVRTDGDVAPAARALLETLAAGEALWRLLGHEPHAYDFALDSSMCTRT